MSGVLILLGFLVGFYRGVPSSATSATDRISTRLDNEIHLRELIAQGKPDEAIRFVKRSRSLSRKEAEAVVEATVAILTATNPAAQFDPEINEYLEHGADSRATDRYRELTGASVLEATMFVDACKLLLVVEAEPRGCAAFLFWLLDSWDWRAVVFRLFMGILIIGGIIGATLYGLFLDDPEGFYEKLNMLLRMR